MRTKVKITVEVETIISHDPSEDVTQRMADIYLHAEGEEGCFDKEDLGGDVKIEILEIL